MKVPIWCALPNGFRNILILSILFSLFVIGRNVHIQILNEKALFTDPPKTLFSSINKGRWKDQLFDSAVRYTVTRHTVYRHQPMVVIASDDPDKAHVDIWSDRSDLLALPDGSVFRMAGKKETTESLEVLQYGSP